MLRQLVTVFVCCAFLAACSPTAITTRSFTDRDLSAVRHYAWYSPGSVDVGTQALNSVALNEAIRDEVIQVLHARGLSETPASQADVLIAYHASFEEQNGTGEQGKKSYHSGDPFQTRNSSIADADNQLPGAEPPRVGNYDQGTLTVEAYDPKTRELLWRSTANSLLPSFLDEEEHRDDLRQLLNKLFADFPPGAGRTPASESRY